MRNKNDFFHLILLVIYILILLFFTVINRESVDKRLVILFLNRTDLYPLGENVRDGLLNIVSFLPIGLLTSLIAQKYKIGKGVLIGLLISSVIELSQLLGGRGVFDVNEWFNNIIGAFMGGVVIVITEYLEKEQ